MLVIEVDRCEGCGACIQTCPQGAISLVEGIARIDSSLCTECRACVEACPTGAIRVATPIAVREAEEATMTAGRAPSPVATVGKGALATLAAATLSFVGRVLLPRVADAVINVMDQRLVQGSAGGTPALTSSPGRDASAATTWGTGQGSGRRRRHRGGQ